MSLQRFEAHLLDPAPGFRCSPAGTRLSTETFIANVKHRIDPPASAKALTMSGTFDGLASSVLGQFVKLHDGLLLYADSQSVAAGVEFFKVSDWRRQTQEMRDSMIAMGFDLDDMPDWFHSGIVFGELPQSCNYFLIQLTGDDAGKVYYCDHDDFNTDPMAESFDDFLNMIVDDPPGFLYRCGCYARYSDGETDTQWIPTEYLADARDA